MTLQQEKVQNSALPQGISLRKDGRYQARFTYNSKRYTIYDRDLKVLCKKYYNIQYELEHNIYKVSSHMTLNQWFQIWAKEYKSLTVKEYTLTNYTNNYNRYIQSPLGKYPLKSIHTLQIQQLFNSLITKGLSVSSVNYLHTMLKGIFKQAVKNNMLSENPSLAVSLPRAAKKARRVLSLYEQNIFFETIQDNYYRFLYMLALSSGLRIGELTGLMWDDINFKQKTITVNRTLLYYKSIHSDKYSFQFQTPKSISSQRTVPLIPDMVKGLKEHRLQQENLRLSTWTPHKGMEQLVFTTRIGTPLQEVYLFKDLISVVKKINLLFPEIHFEPITPHTLRHPYVNPALKIFFK